MKRLPPRDRAGVAVLLICIFPFVAREQLSAASAGKQAGSAASAPAGPAMLVEISRAIPRVGERIEAAAIIRAAPPGSVWRVRVAVRGPASETAGELVRRQVIAPADRRARIDVPIVFARPGWYSLTFHARNPRSGKEASAEIRIPVTRYRVDFAWYQAEKARNIRWVTIQLTAGKPEEQQYWRARGVLPARWCGAACGRDKPEEFFVRKWSSFPAIAIDEFGGGREACEKFTRALKKARARNPDGFIAVWFVGAREYWARLRDTIDLFLPEVYLNYGPYNLTRLDDVVRDARAAGVFHKMLPGLGINVVRNKKGAIKRRPTPEEVIAEIAHLKHIAPDLRGLAFFTYAQAEPAVRQAAHQACRDYFLAPVIDLLEARAVPERPRTDDPIRIEALVRNAGGMPARGVCLRVKDAHGTVISAATIPHLPSRGERIVPIALEDTRAPRWGVLSVEVEKQEGVTRLHCTAHAPYARLSVARTVGYLPPIPVGMPAGFPLDILPPSRDAALRSADGTAVFAEFANADGTPADRGTRGVLRRLLGGRRTLTVLSPRIPADAPILVSFHTKAESGNAHPTVPVTLRKQDDGTIAIHTPVFDALFSPARDAFLSIRSGKPRRELLASPWKLTWNAWHGFGKAGIRRIETGVEITVPTAGGVIDGTSRYTIYPGCIEIERRFEARTEMTVNYAAEGARFVQRPGAFALQFGVGARPRCGRLKVTNQYQDLYFGSPGLGPDKAECGGWFDFSWDAPYDVGLGVAVLRQWKHRGSKVGYDVTRWYDAADWIEIVQVWHTPVRVRRGYSRILLIPHGGVRLSEPRGNSSAWAVWQRLHTPGRTLGSTAAAAR